MSMIALTIVRKNLNRNIHPCNLDRIPLACRTYTHVELTRWIIALQESDCQW